MFVEKGFFLARTVDLLAEEKCGKGHEHPSTLGRRQGGRRVPGDEEAHLHLTLPAPTPLGITQLLWPVLKRSRVLISNMFQLVGGPESNPRCSHTL